MGMPWFRMYHEMIEDPKIGTLNDAQFRVWVELLCLACAAGDEGDIHLTEDELNWKLRRNVSETLQELFQRELIVVQNNVNDKKTIIIKNWSKRQCQSDSSTERVRKHREKSKSKSVEKDETLQKRSSNGIDKIRIDNNKDFDVFWSAYPKKKNKGQAKKTWAKLSKSKQLPVIGVLLDAIASAKQSKDWKKDGGQFIPHPSTWLNAEGWNDECSQDRTEPVTEVVECGITSDFDFLGIRS